MPVSVSLWMQWGRLGRHYDPYLELRKMPLRRISDLSTVTLLKGGKAESELKNFCQIIYNFQGPTSSRGALYVWEMFCFRFVCFSPFDSNLLIIFKENYQLLLWPEAWVYWRKYYHLHSNRKDIHKLLVQYEQSPSLPFCSNPNRASRLWRWVNTLAFGTRKHWKIKDSKKKKRVLKIR